MERNKASNAQLRMIYGLAKKAGMDSDTLHTVVDRLCRRESLSMLTVRDGNHVIEYLRRHLGEVDEAPGMATERQREYILGLARRMGWADNPLRLRNYLRAQYKVADVRFLTQRQASAVIDSLKAIQKGGRAEREASG